MPARPVAAPDSIASRVTEFRLLNGMQFLILERHQAPVVALVLHVNAGAVQDPRGATGVAHLLEHMAFKGTSAIGTRDYDLEFPALENADRAYKALRSEQNKGNRADRNTLENLQRAFSEASAKADSFAVTNALSGIVTKAGGRDFNASTGMDKTTYTLRLPSNEVELWFLIQSERLLDPVMREFYKERSVVIEERRLFESQPSGRITEALQSSAYRAHPYRDPVVGHVSDLEALSRQACEAFFRQHYVPRNLIAVLVGDLAPQHVRTLAEKYFGRLPDGVPSPPFETVEPAQNDERRVVLPLESQPVLEMAFHRPGASDPDCAVYEVLYSLLAEGNASRLHRDLVSERHIAAEVGGLPNFPGEHYPSLFVLEVLPAPGHSTQEAENALGEQLAMLRTGLVDIHELEAVKQRLRGRLTRGLHSSLSLAIALADAQAFTGDWRNYFRRIEQIEAVTPSDIQRVARSTFRRLNRTTVTVEPRATFNEEAGK
jgi:predicted Zn-dependent peptidase